MLCAPRSFSFFPITAAEEKRARISPQSSPGDLALRVLLSHEVSVTVKFLGKFRQMNFCLQVTTEHEIPERKANSSKNYLHHLKWTER